MLRRLLCEMLPAFSLRLITTAVALVFFAGCSDSVTSVVEKYLQTPGQLSVTVIGHSWCLVAEDGTPISSPLANVTVTAIRRSGALSNITAATDADGNAQLDLHAGVYDIRIEADGFEPITLEDNIVVPFALTALGGVGLAELEDNFFPNGVAAGDVNQSSAVLWTRAKSEGTVRFEYGQDSSFSVATDGFQVRPVISSNGLTIPSKAYISGLSAGTQYYYRACLGDWCQPSELPGCESRGSFRTPSASGRNGLTFGVSSCAAADLRPFVSIKNIPDRDLDFFVALGDTVYADNPIGVGPSFANELKDFRKKNELGYSQVESASDNYFAQVRASAASFVSIDDHEILNNVAGGATPRSQIASLECTSPSGSKRCICDPDNDPNENCDREFINETDLFLDGLQAWKDYNPVDDHEHYGETNDRRTAHKDKLYRYRRFGHDAAIFMLDARSFRDEPITAGGQDIFTLPAQAYDPGRTMLGSAQLSELLRDLQDAQTKGITWKFVLVPEPIQNLGNIAAADRFEGYAYERAKILEYIETQKIVNVVFISGDVHGTIVNNLAYKTHVLGLKHYSGTWDISTGPIAYNPPYGPQIIDKLPGDTGIYPSLSPRLQNALIETLMNGILVPNRYPKIGLFPEFLLPGFLDAENLITPAILLQGQYAVTNVFGWTEFDIDAATQLLTVTTYGIEYYEQDSIESPLADSMPPFIDREPSIVSKFSVVPILQFKNGTTCFDDKNCVSGRCSLIGDGLLATCQARLPNSFKCANDNDCISGRCSTIGGGIFPTCQAKLPKGESCLNNADCRSGSCSGVLLFRKCD